MSETSASTHTPYEYSSDSSSSSSKYSFEYDSDLSISYLKISKVRKHPPASETKEEIPTSISLAPTKKERSSANPKDLPTPRLADGKYLRGKTTPRRVEEMYQRGKNQKRLELHHFMETKSNRVELSVLQPINNNKTLAESSIRLHELYEKGKERNRTDLESFLTKKNARKYLYVDKKHMKLEKPKVITAEMMAYRKRMFQLRKKNQDIAIKRRTQIARARARVSESISFQVSNGDSSSLSSSSSSAVSSKSMFELRIKNNEFVRKRKMQIARARAARARKSLPFHTQVSNDDSSSISSTHSSDISSKSMFEIRTTHPVIEIKRKMQIRRDKARTCESLSDKVLVADTTEDTNSMSSCKASTKSNVKSCPRLTELYSIGKEKQQGKQKPSNKDDEPTNQDESRSDNNSPRSIDSSSDSKFFEKLKASKHLSPRSNMILAMGSTSALSTLDVSTD